MLMRMILIISGILLEGQAEGRKIAPNDAIEANLRCGKDWRKAAYACTRPRRMQG